MQAISVKLKLRKIGRWPKPKSGLFDNKCDGLFISEAGDISDIYSHELQLVYTLDIEQLAGSLSGGSPRIIKKRWLYIKAWAIYAQQLYKLQLRGRMIT